MEGVNMGNPKSPLSIYLEKCFSMRSVSPREEHEMKPVIASLFIILLSAFL